MFPHLPVHAGNRRPTPLGEAQPRPGGDLEPDPALQPDLQALLLDFADTNFPGELTLSRSMR